MCMYIYICIPHIMYFYPKYTHARTHTHTHTYSSLVAINTELHRFEFLLMMLLVHATKVMIEALHAWAQSQHRIVVYFRSDDNGGRETATLDEIRTSAWGKIKLQ